MKEEMDLRNKLNIWIILLTIIVVFLTVPVAQWTSMGNDEIYVFEVSRQPTLTDIWSALRAGADNLPPMNYWLRHLSMSVLGSSPLAFRLPSLVAIWITAVFLFLLLYRRAGPIYGASAALLMLLWGQSFSVNDRGYTLLLSSFAVSLYAWDGFENKPSSLWRQLLFVLSLLVAMYSHYYGVLFFLAYGLAAAARSVIERRLWARAFLLLAGAAMGCIPLLALAKTASAYRANFWTDVNLTAALDFYEKLLSPVLTALVLMTVFLSILLWSTPGRWLGRLPLSYSSILAIGMFSLQPVGLFLIAKLLTGAFTPRYVVEAGVAFCLLFLILAGKVPLTLRVRAMIFVGVPAVFLAISTARVFRSFTFQYRDNFVTALRQLEGSTKLPVVLGDDGLFVEIAYAYPEIIKNCYFIYDAFPQHKTNVDLAIRGIKQVMALQAIPYDVMEKNHSTFLFIGAWGSPALRRALADGGKVLFHPTTGLDTWEVSTEPARPLGRS